MPLRFRSGALFIFFLHILINLFILNVRVKQEIWISMHTRILAQRPTNIVFIQKWPNLVGLESQFPWFWIDIWNVSLMLSLFWVSVKSLDFSVINQKIVSFWRVNFMNFFHFVWDIYPVCNIGSQMIWKIIYRIIFVLLQPSLTCLATLMPSNNSRACSYNWWCNCIHSLSLINWKEQLCLWTFSFLDPIV